jgi:hypothetical protein
MLNSPLQPVLRDVLQPALDGRAPSGLAAPSFSPVAGAYGPTQNVTLSSTPGVPIYYTTDGSDPDDGDTEYSGPIEVAATTTIKAIAIDGVRPNSPVSSATYTINGAVATPTFDPVAGTYGEAQTVTINCATGGASLFYTLNGDAPTSASTPYTVPVLVTDQTIKAIGIKTGYSNSAVGSAAYVISVAFDPATLFAGGEKGAWYDPSDLDTLWQDTAGTTPAVVGDPVGRIDDKSGNDYHLIQGTAGSRPTLRQDGSSNYYLENDGTADKMACSSFTLTGADIYAIAGWKSPAAATAYERIYSLAATSSGLDYNDWAHIALMLRNAGAASWNSFRATEVGAAVSLANDTLGVIETASNATGSIAALNGGADATGSHTAGSSLTLGFLTLFGSTGEAQVTGAARYYGGLIIDRIPDAAERSDLVEFINDKTGAF